MAYKLHMQRFHNNPKKLISVDRVLVCCCFCSGSDCKSFIKVLANLVAVQTKKKKNLELQNLSSAPGSQPVIMIIIMTMIMMFMINQRICPSVVSPAEKTRFIS